MTKMPADDTALLVGFLNTIHLPDGVDRLAGSGPQDWIADGRTGGGRGLGPAVVSDAATSRRLAALRRLRETLRGLTAERPAGRAELAAGDEAFGAVPLTLHWGGDPSRAPSLRPAAGRANWFDQQVAAVATACLRSSADGTLNRVKICARPECRWAFFDLSKNCSRRWCSMRDCGNLAKNRAYRARLAGA